MKKHAFAESKDSAPYCATCGMRFEDGSHLPIGLALGAALGAVLDREFPELSGVLPLRDLFAAAALAGICAREDSVTLFDAAADEAYRCADAMLAERRKEP